MLTGRQAVELGIRSAIPAILLGFLALGAVLVFRSAGLGWDEAVYASRARSFVTDVPASAWNLFRPPGLAWLGVLAAPVGFFDESVRLLAMVAAVAGFCAYALLATLVGGRPATIVALLGASTMPVVLAQLPLFHNDLMSAGILFALMAVLWHQLEVRAAPDWRLLLAPALAALAFYVRFGTLAAITGIACTALILWASKLVRYRWLTVGVVVVGTALAAPHVLSAIRETGSPLGIVTISVDKVNTTGPLRAALTYLRAMNGSIAGPGGIALMLAGAVYGLALAVQLIRRRANRRAARGAAWLLLPALITLVALLLVSHAEGRYLLFSLLLSVLAGAVGVSAAVRALIRRRPTGLAARRALPLAAGGLLIVVAALFVRNAVTRPASAPDQAAWVAQTGAWIHGRTSGQCLVVSTLYPILGWYSACASDEFRNAPQQLMPDGAPAEATYLVFTSVDGRHRSAATVARYRAIASEPLITIGTMTKGAEVTLLRP